MLEVDEVGPKKLLIALACTFRTPRWTAKGGETGCYECAAEDEFSADPECPVCWGRGVLWFDGPAQRHADGFLHDYCLAVWTIHSCVEKEWDPVTFQAQPAKWIEALMFVTPFIVRELDRREEARMARARSEAEAIRAPTR